MTKLLAVALLLHAATTNAVDQSKKRIAVSPLDAKEISAQMEEAMKEEEPMLDEEVHKEKNLRTQVLLRSEDPAKQTEKIGHAVKEGEIDISKNPFSLDGEWASDFEKDVSSLILGLSSGGFGATPFGDSVQKISDLIEKEMMPKVNEAHAIAQDELNRLFDEIEECRTTKAGELVTTGELGTAYTDKSVEHKECRAAESVLYTTNVDCHESWITAKEEMKLKCDAYEAKSAEYGETTNNENIVRKAASEDVHTYIQRISTTVCGANPYSCDHCTGTTTGETTGETGEGTGETTGETGEGTGETTGGGGGEPCPGDKGMLEDLDCHDKECKDQTDWYNHLTTQCAIDDANWVEKRQECDNIQNDMDTKSCTWAVSVKDLCEKYESCHHDKYSAYDAYKNTIMGEEQDRKAEWRGLRRMGCLINAFKDGEVTHEEIDYCKNLTWTTDHLTIVYHEAAQIAMDECIITELYPNTAAYKAEEYTPLPHNAKGVADANECAGLAEVNTMAKTGSPNTCGCERIAMDGPYTPGAVVKCRNCHDISKSEDENSCPDGTKLFSPQSQQDWETFLKSADPYDATTGVKDEHWIVDVTCPEDSCPTVPLNTLAQTDLAAREQWQTSDGSPWWLRDAKMEGGSPYTLVGYSYCRGAGGDTEVPTVATYTGKTAEECQAKCDEIEHCTGYHYHTDERCNIHSGSVVPHAVLSTETVGTCYRKVVPSYTANCYMALTMLSGATADQVTYHMDACNYHSKSYYCQQISVFLEPGAGSPDGCTCKKVETVGAYSSGNLMKCEKCLDVYKSMQANSCPAGSKIFSPRTREDWKTFIASAGPLRNPFWIIDVTRPQDGCGEGCTTAAMNHGVPAQATWATADGSDWWLRETAFSQPSGDYQANCYMDLVKNPENEDGVEFDDHTCYAHSRSYYCQSVATTTSTTTTPQVCSHYTCTTPGWVKISGSESLADPQESTCCEATCAAYTCPVNYAMRSGVDDQVGVTDDKCCEATCAAHTCVEGSKKDNIESTVGSTDEICCETYSLTPSSGSPSSCACTALTLSGTYSAGAILKCQDCTTVTNTNQANSCPTGTKLFAPASEADWETFFNSGGSALSAPYWIIDVTRAANSCGGCTSYAMNSGNVQQASWHTSDGQPWWFRSSTYGEPNGDYQANCYLDLWSSPSSASNIMWNDWNCKYSSKSYYCQPGEVTPTVTITPRSGSPSSCSCTNIELVGTYSAGMLARCEECDSVSKKTQTNSCPDGMKLFSPASETDWTTFFNSGAAALSAPYWIIDVTRPQNSCGGCTSYAMNSGNAQQASWVTSDGSPWWFRSSTYGEPNGDYQANCYLDLWSSPSSASNIMWNDWNCLYNSKSYYCQSTTR